REKIASRNRDQSCVGRSNALIPILSEKGHLDRVAHANAKGIASEPDIARIFIPQSADSRFYHVAGRDTGHAHAITLSESVPMTVILLRFANQCSPTGGNSARKQALRTDCA